MAQEASPLDQANFCCSICVDLLKDPVTIPCGHNYCMRCIKSFWDGEDEKKIYSCPKCSQTFIRRPVLVEDHCYAGPEDVGCDSCSGRKLKAIKSCLQCLVSYCEQHLQPHYDSPGFKNHKLVDPLKKLQENICSQHHEVMKMFCRNDLECICYLCSVDKHRGHDIVSAAAERTEKQRELEKSRLQVQQRIQDREKDLKVFQQNLMAMNFSADEAVRDIQAIFNQLICIMEKKSYEVTQQIRSQQETEVHQAEELQEKLEQEITELRRKEAELQQLAHTEDHIQFLLSYTSLPHLSESPPSATIKIRPLRDFEEVVTPVSEVTNKLQNILREEWIKNSPTPTDVKVSPSPAQDKTRTELLRHSRQITLDPNTASTGVLLLERNRKATVRPNSRFNDRHQVLSVESLTGRCYWEVEGKGRFAVAVAYKDSSRTGIGCTFGKNEKSWSFYYSGNYYEFIHDSITSHGSIRPSSRVGVYLDYSAGVLSFFSVSDTTTQIHSVQTTFTQPLYAGLQLFGTLFCTPTAELCEFK